MKTKHFEFWYKWLLAVSICNIILGLIIALAPSSFFFQYHTEAITQIFFSGYLPGEAQQLRRFLCGIAGGTIAGYFLLQTCIVWIPFYRRELWSWQAIFWAMLLWFVIDSGMSIYHGAYFNIWMINIWPLLLTLFPLVMTYKSFKKQDPVGISAD